MPDFSPLIFSFFLKKPPSPSYSHPNSKPAQLFPLLFSQIFEDSKKHLTFAPLLNDSCSLKSGAVVQLVRIQACHAWGRGFESRPHRLSKTKIQAKSWSLILWDFFFFRPPKQKVPNPGNSHGLIRWTFSDEKKSNDLRRFSLFYNVLQIKFRDTWT